MVLLKVRWKSLAAEVRECGPMMRISVLELLSLRKISSSQEFMSERQSERVEWVWGLMELVDMYN